MDLMLTKNNSGQAALIILLIMVALLTIGLSVVSHSVTDISISQDEEEAMRAFSAAEAGIEEALGQVDLGSWDPGGPISVGDLNANVSVSPISEIERTINQNEFTNIILQGFTGDLIVKWDEGAALEMTVFQSTGEIRRYGYTGGDGCSSGFNNDPDRQVTIIVNPQDVLLRIRALCSETTITLETTGSLPTQEYSIDSRAVAGAGEESKTSAIQVSRTIPALPPIFDYVLFSGGDLVK